MAFFYVLKSEKDNKFYYGSTSNLESRKEAHNKGLVKSTKNRRPFKLVYSEEYDTINEARYREYKVKHSANERRKIKNIIEN